MALTLDDFQNVMAQKLEESSCGMIKLEVKKNDSKDYFLFETSPTSLAKEIRDIFELTVMKELAKAFQEVK